MEEIGPSNGLLAPSPSLQLVTIEGSSPHDGSAATNTGLELLAAAAVMLMRSPTPSSPSDLFLLGAGPPLTVSAAPDDTAMDVSMDALLEALEDTDTAPLLELLDVAWDILMRLHLPLNHVLLLLLRPLLRRLLLMLGHYRLFRRSLRCAADPDEEKSDSDPYDVDELLAAAEYVLERPKLPEPPERHPSARWWNHFNPDASVNTRRNYPLKKLLDRWGTPPHVAYLVEWDVTPCQISWARESSNFNAYNRQYFRGAGASETGLCFPESVRVACFDLGHPDLVYGCHWTNFCTEYAKDLSNGVVRAVIAAFFEFLRRQQVCLDYDVLLPNQLDVTITDGKILGRFAQSLQSGHYLVHAAHDLVEHGFTLVVNAHEPGKLLKKLEVLDGYGFDYNPLC
ncbi:hypothetical protein F441_01672 [Phytophthora nicotianae CJ01A1]|uniref:Uncharacterized protein n=1 Tax=Phytophthora nicotianae CJ01A1 TaxID=1317063 RepID=W2XSR7_PHYNI|nr:hypothetical protein F441_01672 [Phytophthora nicotianae CJ01A1]